MYALPRDSRYWIYETYNNSTAEDVRTESRRPQIEYRECCRLGKLGVRAGRHPKSLVCVSEHGRESVQARSGHKSRTGQIEDDAPKVPIIGRGVHVRMSSVTGVERGYERYRAATNSDAVWTREN